MEKKTIGRFISVLRRSHGMTQRELGDKLFVSDKTVSRWERDECTPDLALIPVIAEIFGVTSDELLRGERNYVEDVKDGEKSDVQKRKSDRQWSNLLYRRMTSYKNLTYISVALPVAGLLGAVIANSGFTRGLVGFCIAALFCFGTVISQLCMASNSTIPLPEGEESDHIKEVKGFNDRVVKNTVGVIFYAVSVLMFCLPICPYTHAGLKFGAWVLLGTAYVLLFLASGWAVYTFFVHPALLKGGVLSEETENTRLRRRAWHNELYARCISGGIIVIILCIIAGIFLGLPFTVFTKPAVFEKYDDFRTFMAEEYLKQQIHHDSDTEVTVKELIDPWGQMVGDSDDPYYEVIESEPASDNLTEVYDSKRGITYKYIHVDNYRVEIDFNKNENGFYATVYTASAIEKGMEIRNGIAALIFSLAALTVLVITGLLIKKRMNIYSAKAV